MATDNNAIKKYHIRKQSGLELDRRADGASTRAEKMSGKLYRSIGKWQFRWRGDGDCVNICESVRIKNKIQKQEPNARSDACELIRISTECRLCSRIESEQTEKGSNNRSLKYANGIFSGILNSFFLNCFFSSLLSIRMLHERQNLTQRRCHSCRSTYGVWDDVLKPHIMWICARWMVFQI